MADQKDGPLPDISAMKRDSAIHFINRYIATEGPLVGKASEYFHAATDERTKRICAEKFMGGLMQAFADVQLPAPVINAYLENIANNVAMPDQVVDIAVELQDELIAGTPALKTEHDNIRAEYAHLINPKP